MRAMGPGHGNTTQREKDHETSAEQVFGDHDPLDLVGALADLGVPAWPSSAC